MDNLQNIVRVIVLGIVLSFPASIWGQIQPVPPLLNKVSYQLSVDKWANTANAKVTVSMDAILDKIDLSNINNHVLTNLALIADSKNWHITQYVRSQDKSGLEMIHVEAEAWLPSSALAGIRDKAKKLSKPGETYNIADIDYSPSQMDMENTHADARATIYSMAKGEIARLQQVYPDQHYFLYSIDFLPPQTVYPMAKMGMAVAAAMAPGVPSPEAAPMEVSAHIFERAMVVIAAKTPVNESSNSGSNH